MDKSISKWTFLCLEIYTETTVLQNNFCWNYCSTQHVYYIFPLQTYIIVLVFFCRTTVIRHANVWHIKWITFYLHHTQTSTHIYHETFMCQYGSFRISWKSKHSQIVRISDSRQPGTMKWPWHFGHDHGVYSQKWAKQVLC